MYDPNLHICKNRIFTYLLHLKCHFFSIYKSINNIHQDTNRNCNINNFHEIWSVNISLVLLVNKSPKQSHGVQIQCVRKRPARSQRLACLVQQPPGHSTLISGTALLPSFITGLSADKMEYSDWSFSLITRHFGIKEIHFTHMVGIGKQCDLC